MTRHPLVVFAQIPPPEHGQSRMVALMLNALEGDSHCGEIHHINARFSKTIDEIGDSSISKFRLCLKFVIQALRIRCRMNHPVLYYVPGPVKWSAVVRDWLILVALRPWYRHLILHWHAIGQGEWAHGSGRQHLSGPRWLDRLARKISGIALHSPELSIVVTRNSAKDALAVTSRMIELVPNGTPDLWQDSETTISQNREERIQFLRSHAEEPVRLLFLSHGSIEKGVLIALKTVESYLNSPDSGKRPVHLTLAGGLAEKAQKTVRALLDSLHETHADRFQSIVLDFVTGNEKRKCFEDADVFLATSRWESFGLTVTEAMASCLPIVAAASDGVSGILPENYPYVAPVDDVECLGKQLSVLIDDLLDSKLAIPGSRLRKHFLENFTDSSFKENIRKVLNINSSPEPLPSSIRLAVYLADQNPKFGRSLGISRMTEVIIEELLRHPVLRLWGRASKSSIRLPEGDNCQILPWGTRSSLTRVFTDHFHPLFPSFQQADLWYFPKGYLPRFGFTCSPSVVTIHDTIIQYDEDHYPQWRSRREYGYWAWMLKHTLRRADLILTVSESAKGQILEFMDRHGIPRKEVKVTYEPCVYEKVPQPEFPAKENYVIHLASREPHKRTSHLIRWWHEMEARDENLPMLHLIGSVPEEVSDLLASSRGIVKRPFLEENSLQAAYQEAKALILPSEIEGFGLPALEAYYLGTPVCFVRGTSVEEILKPATSKGSFSLDDAASLENALKEVMAMSEGEIRECGLKLRETYASEKVAVRMIEAFRSVVR